MPEELNLVNHIYQPHAEAGFSPQDIIRTCLENGYLSVLLIGKHLPDQVFDLSTGLLGELLHQLSKYRIPLALVIEDPLQYSTSFQAFLREANLRGDIQSFPDRADAVRWLTAHPSSGTNRSETAPGQPTAGSHRIYLKTPRLDLRAADMKDLDRVVQSWDPEGKTIPLEQAERQIHWMAANHQELAAGKMQHLCLAVIHRETEAWVGWCGIDNRQTTAESPVLFYRIHPAHRDRGFATEAARAVLDYGLHSLHLPTLQARTKPENTASRRVLDKIGMDYLGKDEDGNHKYSISSSEI
jgi:RimJ/RimL family protein N-acetyltransferase